jgi:cobalamin biosynthesis protein CobW
MSKVPATIITGFLGAGKTTLIRHMLENAGGRRIALIINEFGDLGVDGEILKSCGSDVCRAEDVIELSNGCICCTVADDFLPAMEAILARAERPDHIVIETSGLALPQPLVRAFQWPGVATQVTVDAVVTVVDGKAVAEGRFAHDEDAVEAARQADDTLDHETPLSELFEDQLTCADLIVLNKTDLMSDADLDVAMEHIAEDARAGVPVLRSAMGKLALNVLLGRGSASEGDIDNRLSHHEKEGEEHEHDDFETFIVTRAEIGDAKAFAEQVAGVIRAHDILRLKGFAAVQGKPMRLTVQAAGPRIETYFDRPFAAGEARTTRLVVIGEKGLDQAAITKALQA